MATSTTRTDRVRDRALELGVYLPLGAYARIRDEVGDLELPNLDRKRLNKLFDDLIERGQERVQPVERAVRKQLRRAERNIDETVTDARREVRKTARAADRRVESAKTTAKKTTRKTTKRATAAANTVAPRMPRVAAPRTAAQLPIEGYDSLTAGDIVAQLRGLTQTDLAKVYKYERAHENRQTILDAIEPKFVVLPIPTYDALTVDEITSRLDNLSSDDLKTLRRYEAETKDRTGVIEKLDTLLA